LAKYQQRLLYLSRDTDEQVVAAAVPKRSLLKQKIKELKKHVTPALPQELGPLFARKAALYLSVRDRVAVLGQRLLPDPARESIRDVVLDREQVRFAVRPLYETRLNARGFGAIVGFPGMGKTYLLRLLLESQVAPTPALVADAEVESWWRSLPVLVISFKGVTPASSEDLALAEFDSKVPAVVRLLHSEMMRIDGSPDFSAFGAAVLERLELGELTVSVLLHLSSYVLLTRCRRRMDSMKDFVAILLADELVQLSRVPLPSPLRRRRLRRRPPGRTSPTPAWSSSRGPSSPPDARGSPPALASSEPMPGVGGPSALPLDPAPVTLGAEVTRSALCAFAQTRRLRLWVGSLSEGFIKRQWRRRLGLSPCALAFCSSWRTSAWPVRWVARSSRVAGASR